MAEIRVPTLGESVSEATIGRWFKKPGDAVKKDEILVELETDKVSLEVAAPSDGVLSEILADEGITVEPGAILGRVTEGAAAAAPAEPPPRAITPLFVRPIEAPAPGGLALGGAVPRARSITERWPRWTPSKLPIATLAPRASGGSPCQWW